MDFIIFSLLPLLFISEKLRLKKLEKLFSVEGISIYLDKSDEINAYVIGRNLVVTEGFLKLNKEEKKAILAHEISHIRLNHYYKLRLFVFSGLFISFMLFQFNILLSLFSLLITFLLQRFIARKQEIEADKFAYKIVGNSLKEVITKYGDKDSSIFSTHPSSIVRLKMLA